MGALEIYLSVHDSTSTEPLGWHFRYFFSRELFRIYELLFRFNELLVRNYEIILFLQQKSPRNNENPRYHLRVQKLGITSLIK